MFMRIWRGLAVLAGLVLFTAAAVPAGAAERTFVAKLEPNQAVLPGDVKARGTATFRLSADGKTLRYKVEVFGIDAVSQIHVHLGADATTPEGVHYHLPPSPEDHGHTVAFLMNFAPKGIAGNGTVAEGTLTAKDLAGPGRSQPLSFLLDHMEKGWTYVNVHIFQDFGQGRKFCCPTGLLGVIRPIK